MRSFFSLLSTAHLLPPAYHDCRQVEAGQLDDSPKLAALQRLLAGIAALAPVRPHALLRVRDGYRALFLPTWRGPGAGASLCFLVPYPLIPNRQRFCCPQGSKCCVIGHPKSFFTLYKAVLAAGQTVSQLDRSGALATHLAAAKDATSRAALSEQLAAAVQQACASVSCVLVPASLVAGGCFPLAAFQQVVVYASEPATQADLRPHLSQATCPLHFLEVPLPNLGPAGPQLRGAPAASAAAAAAAAAVPQTGAAAGQAAPAAPPGVARVQHAARTVAPAAAQPAAAAPCKDWPLIISSDPRRPIRCAAGRASSVLVGCPPDCRTCRPPVPALESLPAHRTGQDMSIHTSPSLRHRSSRPLYEAVLALEQQGAAVVERPLSLVDLVLSPSAGLVVCDNSAAKLVRCC